MLTLTLLLSLASGMAAPATDTLEYVVLNHGVLRGEMRVVTRGDTVLVRYHRTPAPRMQAIYWLRANGSLRSVEVRGLSPDLQATGVSERFEIADRSARWLSPVDSGSTQADHVGFYHLTEDTPYGTGLLASFLLGQQSQIAPLFPAGTASARIAVDTTIDVARENHRLRLVMIEGLAIESTAVWLDERGVLFASDAGWFITVRRGAEAVLPNLRAIEHRYRARAVEQLAQRLSPSSSRAVVLRNGDVFDSEQGVILPRTTVVIVADRIVAVGAENSIEIPMGACVIDATGKTILPGLWDMHTHARTGLDAVLTLASGITTTRSVGADMDVEIAQRDRAAAGTVISPRVLLAGFMDGPGARRAVPTAALVSTEDEARLWVARYDSLGYRQIKVYDSLHPFLIAPIAEEAKARGMRLSGHIPRGISVQAAVHMGFDEIQHVYHLVSSFYPDSLFIPRQRAPAAVAAVVAPNFDLDARQVTELLTLLHQKGTVIDGTFNRVQDPFEALTDGTDPVYGTTLAWLPPQVRRARLTPVPAPTSQRALATRASSAMYMRLLKRMFDAGITLVPGTDNFPLAYHGELEIYERAGIPANRVLQIATIVPARVMGDNEDYGSIAPGKIADLVVVDGQPATRVQDLRRAEFVVRAGRVYSTRDLYAAAGLTPRW